VGKETCWWERKPVGGFDKKGSTLLGTNISHLGKRKIIDSKVPAGRGYVSFVEGIHWLDDFPCDSLI